jgi:hypothetical protein
MAANLVGRKPEFDRQLSLIAAVQMAKKTIARQAAVGQERTYKKDQAEYQMKMSLKSPGALSAFP